MNTIRFNSLDELDARKLIGCKVVDESGAAVGIVDGLWMDSNSKRVEYVGVKSDSFSGEVYVVPAGDAQIIEEEYLIKIRYPAALIKKAPSFSSSVDREVVEKSDQAFFNQKGFVTDSMSEVDASEELLRAQDEAKTRNREDRTKSGALD